MDKLLKILGTIYDTKNRMKAVLGTQSDDICEYPTLIHNYFVDAYNEYYPDGYEDGYNDAWTQILGIQPLVPPTTPEQRQPQEYTPNIPTVTEYRDQRLADNLALIMEEVRIARLGMKEALGTNSDLFVTYPDLLENMIEHDGNFYDKGYDDGWDDAELIISGLTLNPPVITRADDLFTITSDYPSGTIKYQIDNGTVMVYTAPITITVGANDRKVLTAWVEAGAQGQYRSDVTQLIIYPDFEQMAFTIETDPNYGNTVYIRVRGKQNSDPKVWYRTGWDNGTWTDWEEASQFNEGIGRNGNIICRTAAVQVNLGQLSTMVTKVQFKCNNPDPINEEYWGYDPNSGANYWPKIELSAQRNVIIYGNIMSLLHADWWVGREFDITDDKAFKRSFDKLLTETSGVSYSIINAENLVLPTNTVKECYCRLFDSQVNLTNTPRLSHITNLSEGCFDSMFKFCRSLTTLPELPNVQLAKNCFAWMFGNCAAVTTIANDYLPAAILAEGCYSYMFFACTGLTTAPNLLAPILVKDCYRGMFSSCSNLNSIKCLAENPKDQENNVYYTAFWLDYVSNTGTFTKKTGIEWNSGRDGIPTGWTVVEE